MSNLFLVTGEGLATPDLTEAGIAGVMRRRVLEAAAALGLEVQVRPLELEELQQADEAFFCNSLIGLWPVRRWRFGPEKVFDDWPMTRRLRRYMLEQGWLA